MPSSLVNLIGAINVCSKESQRSLEPHVDKGLLSKCMDAQAHFTFHWTHISHICTVKSQGLSGMSESTAVHKFKMGPDQKVMLLSFISWVFAGLISCEVYSSEAHWLP